MRRASLLLAPLGVVLLAGLAAGTSVLRLDFDELVSHAVAILEGRVVAVEPGLDARGMIVTRVTVVVDRGFKGVGGGETFQLALPGGELGDLGTVVAGMPRFERGEDVLLFATEETERGVRLPVGLGQGVWRVRTDPISGARTLHRSYGDVSVFDRSGEPLPTPAPESVDHAVLVERLERALADQAAPGHETETETGADDEAGR